MRKLIEKVLHASQLSKRRRAEKIAWNNNHINCRQPIFLPKVLCWPKNLLKISQQSLRRKEREREQGEEKREGVRGEEGEDRGERRGGRERKGGRGEGGVEKPEENQMESVFQSNPTNQPVLFWFVLHLFPSTKGNSQFVIEMKSTSQEVTAVKARHLF